MAAPEKSRIRQSFDRAAETYDAVTPVQRLVCHALQQTLARERMVKTCASGSSDPIRVLDAGCGTGFALPLIQQTFPEAQILALDFSFSMLCHMRRARVGMPQSALAADMEQLPLADASLDVYWSSLAIQWCQTERVLHEAARCLRPGGLLAIATLGPKTFQELSLAFSTVDPHPHTISFESPTHLLALLSGAGFIAVSPQFLTETVYYPSVRELLWAVKQSGANQLGNDRRTTLLGRSAYRRLCAAYEQQRTEQGLPLSYDVITLLARKPDTENNSCLPPF